MKKELIRTEDYILVVDESEIKDDDWFYNPFKKMISINSNPDRCYKIIFHLPLNDSPILEGVLLLPPIEEDAEYLAKEYLFNVYQKHFNIESNDEQFGVLKGFIGGYNKAREKYKFTEEDMRKLFATTLENAPSAESHSRMITDKQYRHFVMDELYSKIIQSFSQPKTPTHFEFEIEVKFYNATLTASGASDFIKTTTNSQGQTVACGKYHFE